VKPGVERGANPYDYLIARVDGEKVDMQVIAVDWGAGYEPYRSKRFPLGVRDASRGQ
jgi:hypothetical protein